MTECAVLDAMERLVSFVGEGRNLTKKNYLTMADARILVPLIQTGDEIDLVIGEDVFLTRSSRELPELHLIFRWSLAAGFLKIRHGKASRTKRGMKLGTDRLDDWQRAFSAFLDVKPLEARYGGRFFFWTEFLDSRVSATADLLYDAGSEGMEIKEMEEIAWEELQYHYALGDVSDDRRMFWKQVYGKDLRLILSDFERLGAVILEGSRARLSPIGMWAMNRWLREHGELAPTVDDLVELPAREFIYAALDSGVSLEVLGQRWCAHRKGRAAIELTDLWREADKETKIAVFSILDFARPEADFIVRGLQSDPELGRYARAWLLQHELIDDIPEEDVQALFVESLALLMDKEDRDVTNSKLSELGSDEELVERIELLWRVRIRETEWVLNELGRRHPSKAVAKAARKALFKHRSSGGATASARNSQLSHS